MLRCTGSPICSESLEENDRGYIALYHRLNTWLAIKIVHISFVHVETKFHRMPIFVVFISLCCLCFSVPWWVCVETSEVWLLLSANLVTCYCSTGCILWTINHRDKQIIDTPCFTCLNSWKVLQDITRTVLIQSKLYEKGIEMVAKPRKITTQLIQLRAITKFSCLISTKESNTIFNAI